MVRVHPLFHIIFLIVAFSTSTSAHTSGISYSQIRVQKYSVEVNLRVNLRDLRFVDELDLNGDHLISKKEVSQVFPQFIPQLLDNYQIQTTKETGYQQLIFWKQGPGPGELTCRITFFFRKQIDDLSFTVTLHHLTDSGHWNIGEVIHFQGTKQLFFNLENPIVNLSMKSSFQKKLESFKLSSTGVIASPFLIGFILGLLLTVPNLGLFIKTLIGFLAPLLSISILVAYNLITLPVAFFSTVSSLSLAYVAAENIFVKDTKNRWILASFFGTFFGATLSHNFLLFIQKATPVDPLGWFLGVFFAITLIGIIIFLLVHSFQKRGWYPKMVVLFSAVLLGFGLFGFWKEIFP